MRPERKSFLKSKNILREDGPFKDSSEKQEYFKYMLSQINNVLRGFSEEHRAYFILFYGLSDYGRWPTEAIAEHYGVDPMEIVKVSESILYSLVPIELSVFARRYFFIKE